MARYDKYEPIAGGFRGKLNADLTLTSGSFMGAVSLNASGKVVVGTAGQTGLVGILVKNAPVQAINGRWATSLAGTPNPAAPIGALAGDIVDVMTAGEIVDIPGTWNPGDVIYAAANGTLSNASAAGSFIVGFVTHDRRFVVRIARGIAAQGA